MISYINRAEELHDTRHVVIAYCENFCPSTAMQVFLLAPQAIQVNHSARDVDLTCNVDDFKTAHDLALRIDAIDGIDFCEYGVISC